MSESGNFFKERLKQFENKNVLIGNNNSIDSSNPSLKLVVSPIKKSTIDNEEMSERNQKSLKITPRIQKNDFQASTTCDLMPIKKVPPVRAPPPSLTTHLKISPLNQKPAVRAPPTSESLAARKVISKNTTVSIENKSNNKITNENNSISQTKEITVPMTTRHEEGPRPAARSQVNIPQRPKAPQVRPPPSDILPAVDSPSTETPSLQPSKENIATKIVVQQDATPPQIVSSTPPIKKLVTQSPSSHPPPPPPPPAVKLIDKIQLENESINRIDSPPPVPPPPPSVTRLHATPVVGWAPPVNKKPTETDAAQVDNNDKVTESHKPPPILVAPPSLESFKKVIKIKKNNASSFPEDDNADTYDEDDDYVNSSWYFDVPKLEATNLMRDCDKIGSFLVRPSDDGQFVLMVRADCDVVKKYKIQPHMNGWVLGDPNNAKKIHTSISNLMAFYCETGAKLGKSNLKLKEPVPKEQ